MKIINNLCNYMISEKLNGSLSLYPSIKIPNEKVVHPSRLAWCYGDLGVLLALNSCQDLNEGKWENEVDNIKNHSIKRLSVDSTMVYDTGLCHGSAGLAAIFHSLYINSPCLELKSTINHWLQDTITNGYHKDGLAGFIKYYDRKFISQDIDVLDGVSGIGLMLLALQNLNKKPSWYTFFMLN